MADLSAAVEEVHDRLKALVAAVHDESVTVTNLRCELERLTAANKMAQRELQTTLTLEDELNETLRRNRTACQALLTKREQLKRDIAQLRRSNFAKMKDVELLRGECNTARFRHDEAQRRRLQDEAAADSLRGKFEHLSAEKDSYSRQVTNLEEKMDAYNRKAARARQTLSSLLLTADESLKLSNLSRHGRDRY